MNNVLNYLDNYLSNQIVVVGCSGGPDSMCLISLLHTYYPDITIVCAHINHNIRKESAEELLFVKKYCNDNNIIFESTVFENEKIDEATLRRKRYIYFEELIKKYNATYLLTAHHGDDLVETIQMRLTRGSNLKGYAGIELSTKKENYTILRPLLYVTKLEVEQHNKENSIEYVIDNSNEKDEYTRNRYRHHILPFLKQENENVHLKYLKFNQELLEYNNYINKIVLDNIDKNMIDNKYYLNNYYNEDNLIKRKIIERLLDINYPDNLYLVEDIHVKNIMDLLDKKSNGVVYLPNNLLFKKTYNYVTIEKNTTVDKKEFRYELKDKIDLENGTIEIVEDNEEKSNYCIRLNTSEIKMPIIIRSRENGDKIKIKNLNGTKKVKDILIDEKISLEERNKIIIVTDSDNNILWVPGIKKSQFDKSKDEKYDIIIKYRKNI